jgi:hypothetical protein
MTQKITLTVDCATADGKLFKRGSLRVIPSFARLGDTADQVLIEQAGVGASFDGRTAPTVALFPCDLIGPQADDGPAWSYNVYYDNCPGNPQPWSFQLLSTNGTAQRLSSYAASPVAQTWAPYLPAPASAPASTSQVLGVSSTDPLVTEWVDQSGGGGGGGSGTVTAVSVATANGFAGTVATPNTTPAVTLKVTADGVLKGNSTTGVVSAAAPGTDYLAPNGSGAALTGITAAQAGADASGAAAGAQAAAEAYTDTETARAEAAEALLAPKANPTFTGTVTVPSTVNATDAAQKAYVDAVAQGLDNKPSVAALASSSITLSGTQTVDGVALTAGMRALATGQSTASQNGIWVVAGSAWTRAPDFASGSSQLGASVFVEGGTSFGSSGWVLQGTSAVTVDTSSQAWTQFSGAGEVNAGSGLSKSGNTLSVAASGAGAGSYTNASLTVGADGRLTSASSGAAPVTGVTAADGSVVIGGTGTAPTVQTGTLDVIATQHPPAASVPMNSKKLTGLANGSASTDSAAFGQIPVIDSTAGDIQPVGTAAAAGSVGKVPDAGHVHKGFAKLATTGTAGFALTNGTPNIISWTAPNDGAIHMFVCVSVAHVTSTETGGTVVVTYQSPVSGAANHFSQILAGALSTDTNGQTGTTIFALVQPGTTVTVQQTSALTGGAATVYVELWGN